MKKNLLIVLAVAILGALMVYASRLPDKTPVSSAAGYISGQRLYRSGSFTGDSIGTPYGELRVEAVIENGRLEDIKNLNLPDADPRAREISRSAPPKLESSAIKAQSAKIDFVSGATMTSFSYQQSLQAALDKAVRD